MKYSGPDSIRSWIIAVACCFINMMMYGMARLSGVLFVASMPRFQVGRTQASFPYTFANFMRNTSGPLVGYLGEKLGVRPVATFGCLLAAVGVGTSYFAQNIDVVTILYGVVFGLGFGLANILLPVKINQYFDKHRATASGLSFSGACLGSFILPSVVEALINTFGLSGTFLVLGAIVLNCVPAALLLKKPDFIIKPRQETIPDNESQSIISGKKVKLYTVEDESRALSHQQLKSTKSGSLKSADGAAVPTSFHNLSYDERMKRLSTQTLLSTYSVRMSSPDPLDIEQILENSKGRRQVDQNAVEFEVNSLNSSTTDSVFGKDNQVDVLTDDKTIDDGKDNACVPVNGTVALDSENRLGKDNKAFRFSNSCTDLYVNNALQGCYSEKDENYVAQVHRTFNRSTNEEKKSGSNSFSIVFDPLFLIVAITNATYCFTFVCMCTVIVDFARDINVSPSNEKYILMSLSVGDLIGRMSLGWITDRGYMTRTNFAAVCFLCQGITTAAIGWSTGFPMVVTLAALYGLSEAPLIVIYPLIIAEYVDEDKQTVAISSSNFLAGPLCLTIAPLVGFFRDGVGSYEYLFIGIGVISVICCLTFFLIPCCIKPKKSAR